MNRNNKQYMALNNYENQVDSIQEIEIVEGTREEKKEFITSARNNFLIWLVLIVIIILLVYS